MIAEKPKNISAQKPAMRKIQPKTKYQDFISGLYGANTWLISSSEYPSLAISFLISPSGTPERNDFLNSLILASVSITNTVRGRKPMLPKDMQMNGLRRHRSSTLIKCRGNK